MYKMCTVWLVPFWSTQVMVYLTATNPWFLSWKKKKNQIYALSILQIKK